MDNHMHNRRRVAKHSFREPILPNDLTEQLRSKINALPESVKTDYLKAEIFSKFVSRDTDPPEVRRTRAINKWLAQEAENEATECRLINTHPKYQILRDVEFAKFVLFCRKLVLAIIGETPPVDALIGSFSGGASTSRSRTRSHPANKYVGKAHATWAAKELFEDIVIPECPGWFHGQVDFNIEVVRGNVLFTVPKNAEIDRVAAKEPDLNMFIQKGIGNYFRKCLHRIGINLNDQSINRSLAQRGSFDGSLATLDLSSASDSVTRELVSMLLPEIWFDLLDSVRSPVTIIDGEEHRNCMFSSMGNGFTFELESLLFYVLMRATAYFTGTRGVVSVYGDDIIIPSSLSQQAEWVLNWFGFQVNTKKSYSEGPFRESCGGHYYNGYDITPFYVRKPIESVTDVIDVANKLRHWSVYPETYTVLQGIQSRVSRPCPVLDPDTEALWLWLKGFVPPFLWGGDDPAYKYQLVSLDTPRSKLVPITTRSRTDLGGYRHWLNATWARTNQSEEGVQTSLISSDTGQLRLRKVREQAVPRLYYQFLHEIDGMTVK